VFYHPARKADASTAENILTRVGYKVKLHPFEVANVNVDGQWVISRIIYYYPADNQPEARTITRLVRSFASLETLQEADPSLVDDNSERSITFYLLDESVVKKPAAPAPTPNSANDPEDENPKPGAVNPASADNPGREQIVAALERNYDAAKKMVDRPEYDDNEAARLLNELEAIAAYAEEQMTKEVPRSARWQRLKKVMDLAQADIRALRERLKKTKPEANSLAGIWRFYIDGKVQPGEFRFGKLTETDLVDLTRDSKPWVTVVSPLSATRIVQLDIRAPVKAPFGDGQIQLRGDASSNRLEFWASQGWESVEYQITKYALVREDN
jgi:hypothetical protein